MFPFGAAIVCVCACASKCECYYDVALDLLHSVGDNLFPIKSLHSIKMVARKHTHSATYAQYTHISKHSCICVCVCGNVAVT